MGFKEELEEAVGEIFREPWTSRDGQVVPDPEDLGLGNDAVKLEGTVLYADMSDSTKLVDNKSAKFAAEVYKTYLSCAAKIIRNQGGDITAYDGDRIMAIFIGNMKNSIAARTALKIHYAVINIINPALKKQYPKTDYQLKHVVGIDSSSLLVARIGVRNDNDLVWVGRAANYAAKLCAINEPDTVFITGDVFDKISTSPTYCNSEKTMLWQERKWSQMGNMRIYSSTKTWKV
jgi:class 3 adenylate cyclase